MDVDRMIVREAADAAFPDGLDENIAAQVRRSCVNDGFAVGGKCGVILNSQVRRELRNDGRGRAGNASPYRQGDTGQAQQGPDDRQ
jgi:hypothetical protein